MARITNERTVQLLQAGDVETLLREASAHAAEFPNEMLGHYLVGRAHFMMGRDEEAQRHLTHAISLEDSDRPFFWRALSRMHTGDDAGAEADFRRARQLDTSAPHIGYELGRLLARLNRFEDARDVLVPTLESAPDYIPARYTLGNVCASLGDHEAARQHWMDVLSLDPGHVDAAYNLGVFHQNRGRSEDALAYFVAVAATGDAAALAKVVQCHHQLGSFAEAQQWLPRAIGAAQAAGQKLICIDQFPVDSFAVMAYRRLDQEDLDPRRDVVFHFVTEGRIAKSLNLESSAYGRETGRPYLLGEDGPGKHITYAKGWREEPSHEELRDAVMAAHRGEIAVAASSALN
jgi:Flp pilus assembly protein TadD